MTTAPATPSGKYAGFGTCPDCGEYNGYLNIGRVHWFYCDEHRTKWIGGSNLFDSWKQQSKDEQRSEYEARSFGSYTYVADTSHEASEYRQHYLDRDADVRTRVR